MSKKVQKYPATAKTSLAHHSLITVMVFDELHRNQISSRVSLEHLGFDLKEDMDKKNAKKKTSDKQTPTSTPKLATKNQNPATTKIRVKHSKPKLKFTYARRVTISMSIENSVPNIVTRKVIKKECKESKGHISVLEIKVVSDQVIREGSKSTLAFKKIFTRPTAKLRLNAKAILNPALKSKEPICIDADSPEPQNNKKGSAHNIKRQSIGVSSSPIDLLLQLEKAAEKLEANNNKGKKKRNKHDK